MTRTGQLELVLALDAALDRAGPDWVATARRKMAEFVKYGVTFTADDLVAAVGMPPGDSHNAVGAVFHAAAGEGWIVDAGTTRSRRPDAHGRKVTRWRGLT